MMGAKSMLILKTHFDSINPRFIINGFLYENLLWILGSVRVFLCNYVLYSFGLILNYIFRVQVGGDRKAENDQFQDSEVDGFREELINFLFESCQDVPEDVYEDGKKSEGEANSSVSMEVHSVSHESKEGGVTESSVLMDSHFNFQKDGEKSEGETEKSVLTEAGSDFYEDEEKSEGGRECSVSMEVHSEENKENSVSMEVHSSYSQEIEKNEGETESSVLMEFHADPYEDVKEREEPKFLALMDVHFDSHEHGRESEGETECSVLHEDVKNEEAKNSVSKKVDSEFQEDHKKKGETESYVLMGIHSNVEDVERKENEKGFDWIRPESEMSTRKYQFVSGGNIRGFMEEPTAMSFTFQEFYAAPNVLVISDNNNNNKFSEHLEEEEEETVQENKFSEHLEEEEEETVQENQFLGCNTSLEGLENESLKQIKDEGSKEFGKSEEMGEKEGSKIEEETQRKKNEAEEWKKMLAELKSDEEIEGDLEWEHDDIVEQLKMEIKNARQGGLPTILEEEEDEQEQEQVEEETEEEAESPEVSEAQKLLKIEDRLKFEDQMDEIQDVYLRYEEKMRKLDILNYQTMHGLGLLQLKDPLKSTFSGAKPAIMSQNIWGKRESKKASDPIMKLVGKLQRDLEMVYVGQICLSWEMLCWQHNKALHLKQHHSNPHHHNPHFNVAAGEFQLFQVLIQRFIENEPFQGPRTHNFVKNRCVIRNLIQVPPIADDSMKEKNMGKEDDDEEEDDAVCSGKLAEIIKESMWLFWRFVRADKDDGSFILRFDHLKDPALSDLVKDIRTILHKKERRLKEIVRSGNCIVRKLQKKQAEEEEELNHEQMIARVEMKLVSRVLNLSKLRKDHLIWCNEKLNRIRFVKKKKKIMVVVDPSFLLFPC